nr:uncharacterized protein LOC109181112 [Ipomoea batatas]GME13584.1 uncharacterized protein LOC109181112 [Ipomoea batatas]GME13585.1 uncharacterized protein LOC109181112 [Ipomoea batatas]
MTARSFKLRKDLLPRAIGNSPRPTTPAAHRELYYGSEISIRNRLVKMEAWAYLKPMSTLTVTTDHSFLRRFLPNRAVCAFVHFVAFKWLFKSLKFNVNNNLPKLEF